jgi:hypothetical protein
VEWGKPGVRGVRLTVAPEGKRSYIYHEEQDDYSALDDISEDSLAKWLRWLAASSPVTSGHYFLRKKPMCSRQFYYILGGLDSRTPVAVDEETYESWVRSAHRKVAVTAVAEGVDVSTFFMSPRPTFETTVFGGKLDGVLIKTESWDAAEAAHQAMVERVREAEGNPVPPVEEGWQRTECSAATVASSRWMSRWARATTTRDPPTGAGAATLNSRWARRNKMAAPTKLPVQLRELDHLLKAIAEADNAAVVAGITVTTRDGRTVQFRLDENGAYQATSGNPEWVDQVRQQYTLNLLLEHYLATRHATNIEHLPDGSISITVKT